MAFAEGQLGKMTIIFYPDITAPGQNGIPFTPMYNPSTLKINHTVTRECKELPVNGNIESKFIRTNPRTMSLDLFFDGTGASPSNLFGAGIDSSKVSPIVNNLLDQINAIPGVNVPGELEATLVNTVDIQIETFLRLGYYPNEENHQPHYLMLIWGSFSMTAVITSANVNYSMFDSTGRPLRGTLSLELKETVDPSFWDKEFKFESADVSKSVTVVAGDTLPLLCFREYGDANLYQQIAEVNNLDNYRNLKPGMELLFPPLVPSN